MEQSELIQLVHNAGVVGSGGAGFPTDVKFKAQGIDTYIINGAECEPLLSVDQYLMAAEAERLHRAAQAVGSALGAGRVVFALKGKYKEAIQALEAAGAEIFKLGSYYPVGDEIILIQEVTGRTVPETHLPLEVGVLVNNVETLYNVAMALESVPLTHSWVTVGGAVARPGIWRVPLGTPAGDLISAAGGAVIPNPVYVDGGPMMGKFHTAPDFFVSKTTKGLLVLPDDGVLARYEMMPVEMMLRQAKFVCMQCSQCTVVCSRNLVGYNLEPHKIMRAIAFRRMLSPEVFQGAFVCSECNICSGLHACPMQLSPRRVNQLLKAALREEGVKPNFPVREIKPKRERKFRLLPSERLEGRLKLSQYSVHYTCAEEHKPSFVQISMRQHIGAPAVPIVAEGETVCCGQLIGRAAEGVLSVNIHASISGVVTSVSDGSVEIRA